MAEVHHRFATVQGRQLFYREAGPRDAPAFVLLHGFPTSSFMYRRLIPALADEYRLIAPDYLGFGFSDAPSADDFDYTFDALADHTGGLLDQLGVDRYALYVQDYGAPVGWRLALRNPDAVTAVVTQSGNAYEEGFVQDCKELYGCLWVWESFRATADPYQVDVGVYDWGSDETYGQVEVRDTKQQEFWSKGAGAPATEQCASGDGQLWWHPSAPVGWSSANTRQECPG